MFAYGMTTTEVPEVSTSNAARLLQMDKELGLIAPDYLADLIAVESNPLEDISALRTPVLVIKNDVIEFNVANQDLSFVLSRIRKSPVTRDGNSNDSNAPCNSRQENVFRLVPRLLDTARRGDQHIGCFEQEIRFASHAITRSCACIPSRYLFHLEQQ